MDAAELLLQKGSALSFKVSDIASEAGVSPSLVIQYFNSKDELVFEVCVRRMTREYPAVFEKPPKDLAAFLEYSFERDLHFAHIAKDVMSLSWRWKPEDEERFLLASQPRIEGLKTCLMALDPSLEGGRLDESVRLVSDLYLSVLRRACVHNGDVKSSMAEISALLSHLRLGR